VVLVRGIGADLLTRALAVVVTAMRCRISSRGTRPGLMISHIFLPGMSSWTRPGTQERVGAKQGAGGDSERSADTSCIWLFVDGRSVASELAGSSKRGWPPRLVNRFNQSLESCGGPSLKHCARPGTSAKWDRRTPNETLKRQPGRAVDLHGGNRTGSIRRRLSIRYRSESSLWVRWPRKEAAADPARPTALLLHPTRAARATSGASAGWCRRATSGAARRDRPGGVDGAQPETR